MTIKTNFFDNGSYTPTDLINEKVALLADGVYGISLGDFLVSEDSPANLSVGVAVGDALKNGYYIKSDAVVNVLITANTSGFNRKDIIVLNVDTTSKITTIIAVAGTPNGSPTAPIPTANQLNIAEVFVGNNVSVINTANITDKRVNVDLFNRQLAGLSHKIVTQATRATNLVSTQNITLGFQPRFVRIRAFLGIAGSANSSYDSDGGFDGVTQIAIIKSGDPTAASLIQATRIILLHSGLGGNYGIIAFTSTGIILTWTADGTALPTGNIIMKIEAF